MAFSSREIYLHLIAHLALSPALRGIEYRRTRHRQKIVDICPK
jgi:hypothetical protein